MPGMRYQPQGLWRLNARYRALTALGWIATRSGYDSIGPGTLIESTRFTAIKSTTGTPNGFALSANAASDNGAIANVATVGYFPVRNNFTFCGVFNVRTTSGAGVGVRSNSNDIFLWRSSNRFQIRVNNVTYAGANFPLGTDLHYVLTSSPAGIYLYVNGVEAIGAPASASSADTGDGLQIYEDSRGGGAMDMDANLCLAFTSGIPREEARRLSTNLWAAFDAPRDRYQARSAATPLTARLGWAEQNETSAAIGSISARLSGTWTEQGETSSTTVSTRVQAAGGWAESGEVVAVSGRSDVLAQASWVESGESTAAQLIVGQAIAVTADWTERGEGQGVALKTSISAVSAWVEGGERTNIAVQAGGERPGDIDALLVPPRQTVVFEGSRRVVAFEGGERVVTFEGSKRLVEFP